MSSPRSEPTFPASEHPQSQVLDRAVIGTGVKLLTNKKILGINGIISELSNAFVFHNR